MRIALDFDETYTRDPYMWNQFISHAVHRKHDIRIVTFRSRDGNNDDIHQAIAALNNPIPVIYTGGIRKRVFCYQVGFMVDVWIDDMPEIIVVDHGYDNVPQNLIRMVME